MRCFNNILYSFINSRRFSSTAGGSPLPELSNFLLVRSSNSTGYFIHLLILGCFFSTAGSSSLPVLQLSLSSVVLNYVAPCCPIRSYHQSFGLQIDLQPVLPAILWFYWSVYCLSFGQCTWSISILLLRPVQVLYQFHFYPALQGHTIWKSKLCTKRKKKKKGHGCLPVHWNLAAETVGKDSGHFLLAQSASACKQNNSHLWHQTNRLVGLVVRRPPPERKIPGSNPACAGIFLGSSHTSDLKIGTPVATLPGAWRYRVSAGIGQPGVSILWLGEMESLVCNFNLSVAVHKIVWADPSLRYTRMLLGR